MKNNVVLTGNHVTLRDIRTDDAEFVLSLRTNEKKAKHIHKTNNDLQQQINYIKNYHEKDNEYYFIVEDKTSQPIGTYRIYDIRDDSFCVGSWLMIDGATAQQVLESDYLVRQFGFNKLGFDKCHYDVRKTNKKVLNYHKLMGAVIVGETDIDYLFECKKDDYYKNIKRYL